ncbi:MAG: GyrI-like domain-containing protein [Polyangiaceae bacterium]|nr:GyrI-like domain-containing protein [Polyangiaceae bacterium]
MISPRWEELPAMLLAGLRRHHEMATAPALIPRQWEAFNATPLRATASVSYGVTCAFDGAARRMEYLCAVEVPSFDGLPDGTGRMRVPPARYAVFDVHGPASSIPAAWAQAMQWEATNGEWKDAHTPAFERYEGAACSLWFPVVKRAG